MGTRMQYDGAPARIRMSSMRSWINPFAEASIENMCSHWLHMPTGSNPADQLLITSFVAHF
ncbi:hypothetical protein H0V99_00570 [Candidatus Saccharibacteria bacterium]|nr:hypothetical protein [Candidatus Saccharibacteria bacterium]